MARILSILNVRQWGNIKTYQFREGEGREGSGGKVLKIVHTGETYRPLRSAAMTCYNRHPTLISCCRNEQPNNHL